MLNEYTLFHCHLSHTYLTTILYVNECLGIRVVMVLLTHIVVPGYGHGCPGARPLLCEVVAELEDAGVVLQHGGDLHLYRVSQLLSL